MAGRRLLRFYVGCAPSSTRNPFPEHSFGDPAPPSPGFPLPLPAGPRGAPDGPSLPASASAPPRPDVGEAAAACASQPVTCSAPPPVLSARGASPGPHHTGRRAPGAPPRRSPVAPSGLLAGDPASPARPLQRPASGDAPILSLLTVAVLLARPPPRPLTVPSSYLKSLPQARGVRGRTGVSATHLHGPPSPSWTKHSSWGTGMRGGVEAQLPQPAPRHCRLRPGRCLEPVCGCGFRSQEGEAGERPLHCPPGARDPARDPARARPAPSWEARLRLRTPHWPAARPMGGGLRGLLPPRDKAKNQPLRRPRSLCVSEPFPLKLNVFGIGPVRQAPA